MLTSLASPDSPPSGDRPCLPRQPVPQVRAWAAALQMEGKSLSQCPLPQEGGLPLPPLLLWEEGCRDRQGPFTAEAAPELRQA